MRCVRLLHGLSPLLACAHFAACGDNNSPSNVTAPGDATKSKTKILEAVSALLQGKQPLEALNVYMNAFRFYRGNAVST